MDLFSRGIARSAVLTLVAITACGGEDRSSSPAADVDDASAWAIAPTPILVIGAEGSPDYEFSGIVGLGRVGTRGWVVADGSSRQLMFYDRDGRFVSRSGGRGEGPGEFQDLTRASVVDEETIYTHDQRLQRVSVWSSDGDFVRSLTLRTPLEGGIAPLMIGMADPRSLIWSSYRIPPCVVNEVVADTVSFYAFDVSEGRPDTDSTVTFLHRGPRALRWGTTINIMQRCVATPVPFAARPLVLAGAGHLHVVSTATSELTSIDVSTGAVTVRSLPGSRLPLSREFLDEYIERELSSEPVDENGAPIPGNLGWAEYGQRLRETPYPDSLPAFDQGIVDSQGWLWLRPYQLPSDTVATWVVLSPTSPAARHIPLSSQFRPFEIGPDYVAGVDVGSLGVETVKVFALTRSAAAVPR